MARYLSVFKVFHSKTSKVRQIIMKKYVNFSRFDMKFLTQSEVMNYERYRKKERILIAITIPLSNNVLSLGIMNFHQESAKYIK